jgi:hypothetical protein
MVRDFVDVEKATQWLADRKAGIHAPPIVDYSLLIRVWQMYLNDKLGDCTCASVAHGLMVFAAMVGVPVTITDADIERMYEHSGWKPGNAASDQGWTLEAAAEFVRTIGMSGTPKDPKPDIDAWAGVDTRDTEGQQIAMEIFGGLSSGCEVQEANMQQFQEGKPFSFVPGNPIAGGHAIWKVKSELLKSGVYVTWGTLEPAEEKWEAELVDEHIAFVPKEWEAKLPEALLEAGIVDFSKLASLVGSYDS